MNAIVPSEEVISTRAFVHQVPAPDTLDSPSFPHAPGRQKLSDTSVTRRWAHQQRFPVPQHAILGYQANARSLAIAATWHQARVRRILPGPLQVVSHEL